MVRRIIWTKRASIVFSKVLQFYIKRNGNKIYSKKLNTEIKQIIDLLGKHPYLGKKTDKENVRVLIKSNYQIFYKLKKDKIIILLVWDTRQDPNSLEIL